MMRNVIPIFILVVVGAGSVLAQEETPRTETRVYELKKALLEETAPLSDSDVPLPEGTSAEFDSQTGLLTVVHYESSFSDVELFLDLLFTTAEPLRSPQPQLHVIYERIEVDHLDFTDWLLENTISNDGTSLREQAQEWARAGRATIVDTTMVTCRSGQRAKTRSGAEFNYPTEPGVPEMPNRIELSGTTEAPIVPRVASAFETRYLGIILEVDPVIGYDGVTIDLNLAPDFTELEKLNRIQAEPEGNVSAVDMPTFHTQRVTTQVSLLDGHYAFLGTTRPHKASDRGRKNPLVLNFVRADVGRISGWRRVE